MITFAKFTDAEDAAVEQIVDRAAAFFRAAGIDHDRVSISMDLAAVHARCPLRFDALAAADDGNFMHDIGGIYRHLNRSTGELENCFVPRYAA